MVSTGVANAIGLTHIYNTPHARARAHNAQRAACVCTHTHAALRATPRARAARAPTYICVALARTRAQWCARRGRVARRRRAVWHAPCHTQHIYVLCVMALPYQYRLYPYLYPAVPLMTVLMMLYHEHADHLSV